jgi:hypothetical protein
MLIIVLNFTNVCGVGQSLQQLAARLLGRLAYNEASKDAIRDSHGIQALLRLLEPGRGDRDLAETVAQSLTILAVNNEVNQDHIRYVTAIIWCVYEKMYRQGTCVCV